MLNIIRNILQENIRKTACIAVFQFFPHIRNNNFRQHGFTVSCRKRIKRISACLCIVIGFYTRCSRAKYKQSIVVRATELSNLSCMVAWRAFGLVAVFLLFVHNNQSDLIKRRKHSTACTYYNLCKTLFYSFVLIKSFAK